MRSSGGGGEDNEREWRRRPLSASPAYYNRLWNPSETPDLMHLTNLMQPGVYRLSFIRENEIRLNESPGASYQDNGFWYQVFSQAKRAMFTDKVCYMLRRDNPNSSVNSTGKVFAICDEYAFIRDVLKRRGREEFLGICARTYFGNCEWTMIRIGEWFLPRFLDRVAADFRMLEEAGELDRRYFSARTWSTMHEIMLHGSDYYQLEWYFRKCVKREKAKVAVQKRNTVQARRATRAQKRKIAKIEASGSYKLGQAVALPVNALRKIRHIKKGAHQTEEEVKQAVKKDIRDPRLDASYQYYSSASFDELVFQINRIYAIRTGANGDFDSPSSYNERALAYRISGKHAEEKARLLNRHSVRELISSELSAEYLESILGVWEDFDSIDFENLPESFVLECTHGRGMSMIVEGKDELDFEFAREQFEAWLDSDFAFHGSLQLEYQGIPRRIIAKPYVVETEDEEAGSVRYRVWCFGGKADFIQVLSEEEGSMKSTFFNRDWIAQPFRYRIPFHQNLASKPDRLDEMIEVGETLSRGLDHVIIGLVVSPNGEVRFEEASFTPDGGYCIWTPPETNFELGELWP